MAHNIEITENGASVMLADKPAWHKLGTIVQGAQTWQDAIKLAGMEWSVAKRQLEYNSELVPAWGIFRDDKEGAEGFLGAVGKSYTPIQNTYSFDFVDTILSADNGAHYESAGVLGKGERVWCMARVPHDFAVDGQDPHTTYLLFTTSHDGSLAATCKLTTVRVVCQNTLSAALSANGTFLRIKHTKEAEKRMEAARKLIGNVVNSVKDVEDKLTTLSYRMLTKETYTAALDSLFPAPKGKAEGDISTRRANIMADITRLFESNDNNAFPDFRGTAYNLLNAITEYTDHNRSIRLTEDRKHLTEIQARAETSIFGSGAALKEQALEIIYDVSANSATRPYRTYVTRALDNGAAARASERDTFGAKIDNSNPYGNLLDDILNGSN